MPAARARTSVDSPPAKPRSDVYVGLLVLALLAQIAGAAFLWLDYSQYPDKAPPKVPDRPRGAAAPAGIPTPAPAPGGGGIAGNPPGGGMGGVPPPGGMMGGGKAPMGMMGGQPPGAMMGKAPG